jgi:energy-coupling factor transporter ATP-binding protein EcfA2
MEIVALTKLVFQFSNKDWLQNEVEHDSEFEYNNQMYDVVEKKKL